MAHQKFQGMAVLFLFIFNGFIFSACKIGPVPASKNSNDIDTLNVRTPMTVGRLTQGSWRSKCHLNPMDAIYSQEELTFEKEKNEMNYISYFYSDSACRNRLYSNQWSSSYQLLYSGTRLVINFVSLYVILHENFVVESFNKNKVCNYTNWKKENTTLFSNLNECPWAQGINSAVTTYTNANQSKVAMDLDGVRFEN